MIKREEEKKSRLISFCNSRTYLAECYDFTENQLKDIKKKEVDPENKNKKCKHDACRLKAYENDECYAHYIIRIKEANKKKPIGNPIKESTKTYKGIF